VDVEFTDLALQALANLHGDDAERWRFAIKFKLKNDIVLDQSRKLPRPDGKAVYLYALSDLHITFENREDCRIVWIISRANSAR
jgi:hypothetical protein